MVNQGFSHYFDVFQEYGVVTQVRSSLVNASGLPGVKLHEVVVFENGAMGEVFSLYKDSIDILLFTKNLTQIGTRIARTGELYSFGVGDYLFGHCVDPFGEYLAAEGVSTNSAKKDLQMDRLPLSIQNRTRITQQLFTGVSVVDLLIPLGVGQRELVMGDSKTGKTTFLHSVIRAQLQLGTIVVYAAIGRKHIDIKRFESQFFSGTNSLMTVISTTADDPAGLIYITPFIAMSVAEYYRDQGKNVLVVFDDLLTHARAYREISLTSRRFPGRDSYPGDVFYVHAKLLERAGSFLTSDNKSVAITCLPVVETVEGDLSGYIPTNLMGMTDGHLFFDTNIFFNGRRPSINTHLSVTRVGRQTQSSLLRDINHVLSSFFTRYESVKNLSHFGAELSADIRRVIRIGDRLYGFFDQPYDLLVPISVQLFFVALLWLDILEDISGDYISHTRSVIVKLYLEGRITDQLDKIVTAETFDALLGQVSTSYQEILKLCET